VLNAQVLHSRNAKNAIKISFLLNNLPNVLVFALLALWEIILLGCVKYARIAKLVKLLLLIVKLANKDNFWFTVEIPVLKIVAINIMEKLQEEFAKNVILHVQSALVLLLLIVYLVTKVLSFSCLQHYVLKHALLALSLIRYKEYVLLAMGV
jgi:hypothetical protein